jgi:hypothetical protein
MILSAVFSLPSLLPPDIAMARSCRYFYERDPFRSWTTLLHSYAVAYFSVEKPYLRGARTRSHAGRRMNLQPVLIELHGKLHS